MNEKTKNKKVLNKIALAVAIILIIVCIPMVLATAAGTYDKAELTRIEMYNSEENPNGVVMNAVSRSYVIGQTREMPEPTATPAPTTTPQAQEAAVPQAAEETPQEEEIDTENVEIGKVDVLYGEDNPVIAKVQERLMELNYMERDSATTKLGPITSAALEAFQRKNGLTITGDADIATQKALFSDSAKTYSVSEGASGIDVGEIQQRLNDLGYEVSITRYFGTQTTKAVKQFQKNNGLTADGTVGAATKEALFSSDAVRNKNSESSSSSSSSNKGNSSSGSSSSNKENSSSSGSSSSNKGNSSSGGSNPGSANSSRVEAFIDAAESQLGKTYVLGGKGPDVFDCSGFIYYALNQSGYSIGYMTSYGWADSSYPTVNGMDNLQRGDIICYNGHVGIYLGGGDMIDASSTQGKIRITSIWGSYWQRNFICGKRPL